MSTHPGAPGSLTVVIPITLDGSPSPSSAIHQVTVTPNLIPSGFSETNQVAERVIDLVARRLAQPKVLNAYARLLSGKPNTPPTAQMLSETADLVNEPIGIYCDTVERFLTENRSNNSAQRFNTRAWGWTEPTQFSGVWVNAAAFAEHPRIGSLAGRSYFVMLTVTILHELAHLLLHRYLKKSKLGVTSPTTPFPGTETACGGEAGYWTERELFGARYDPSFVMTYFDAARVVLHSLLFELPAFSFLAPPIAPRNLFEHIVSLDAQAPQEMGFMQTDATVYHDFLTIGHGGIVPFRPTATRSVGLWEYRMRQSCECVPKLVPTLRQMVSKYLNVPFVYRLGGGGCDLPPATDAARL